MKRVENLYHKITDIKNIKDMYDKRIRINTKNKVKIERFDEHYVSNLVRIKEILESKNYKPYRYNIFLIREPKVRLIMAQSVTDKIINHLVSKYFLVDVFEPILKENNVATRIGKGTHYGIKKLKTFLRKNIKKDLYILKFDVTKYFFNLNHENDIIEKIKKREIEKIKNSNVANKEKLLKEIESIPLCKNGVSAPIGNMSSQAFAIIYLNEIDSYIVEVLKPMFYLRYQL